MKYSLLILALLTTACSDNEQDKLRKQQQQLTQQQQLLNQQQYELSQHQQPVQQYQQPVVVQQPPVVVQQSPNSSSHVADMITGAVAGAMLNNALSGRNNQPSYDEHPRYNQPSYVQPRNVTNVTKNITINKAPAARPSSARMPSAVRGKK